MSSPPPTAPPPLPPPDPSRQCSRILEFNPNLILAEIYVKRAPKLVGKSKKTILDFQKLDLTFLQWAAATFFISSVIFSLISFVLICSSWLEMSTWPGASPNCFHPFFSIHWFTAFSSTRSSSRMLWNKLIFNHSLALDSRNVALLLVNAFPGAYQHFARTSRHFPGLYNAFRDFMAFPDQVFARNKTI